ncbi:PAS domain-containing protein [Pedobacter sp. SYSU D00535]|uniref:PAS domain-containing protein n=1 Tax=Pedobacter sp. SYSU D00535 TaxID=2810308 RepID=UPI001A974B5C|nr:PAS domain-containing protein [Pedobacter sp. SYSU D00535]
MKIDWYKNIAELLLMNGRIQAATTFHPEGLGFLYPVKTFALANDVWWVEQVDHLNTRIISTGRQQQPLHPQFFQPFFSLEQPAVLDAAAMHQLQTKLEIPSGTAVLVPVRHNGISAFLLLHYASAPNYCTGYADFLSILQLRITELVEKWQRERQLEKVRLRFKGILESISQSVVFIAENEHYCWMNANACRLLDVKEKNPGLLRVREAMLRLRSRASNAAEIEVEMLQAFQGRTKDNWYWRLEEPWMVLKVSCRRLKSEGLQGMLWVFDDVSRMLAYEEQLEEKNKTLELHYRQLEQVTERYVLAGKATNDAIWDWNLQENTISWSNSFVENFGYEQETNPELWYSNIHPKDQDRVLQSIYRVINSDDLSNWEEQYRYYNRKKGGFVYVKDRGFVIRDEKGRSLRMVGSMQDITQLKKKEREALLQNARLQEIAVMNSHLVRKPVANILGIIQLLRTAGPAELNELIPLLEACGEELDQVVKEINNKSNLDYKKRIFPLTEGK